MHTAPSQYSTGMSNGYEIVYFVVINLSGGSNRVILSTSSLPVGTITTRYNSIALSLASDKYKPEWLGPIIISSGQEREINPINEIDYALELQSLGGMAPVNECVIQLLNQELFSNFITEYDIENEVVEVWEGYVPPSGTFDIDVHCILRFKGVISSSGAWDYETFSIPCIDSRHLNAVMLPRKKITLEDYPYAPDDTIGQCIPIVVGNFMTNWTTFKQDGIILLLVNKYTMQYIGCAHQTAYDSENEATYYFQEDIGIGEIGSAVARTIDANGMLVTLGLYSDARVNIYGDFRLTPELRGRLFSRTSADGHVSAVDQDFTTGTNLGNSEQLWLGYAGFDFPGEMIHSHHYDHPLDNDRFADDTDVLVYVFCSNIVGTPKLRVIDTIDDGTLLCDVTINSTQFEQAVVLLPGTVDPNWDVFLRTEVGIYCDGSSSITVNEVYVRVRSRLSKLKISVPPSAAKVVGYPANAVRLFGGTGGRVQR